MTTAKEFIEFFETMPGETEILIIKKKTTNEITYSDFQMIEYFALNTRGIERWMDWKERKDIIKEEEPELYALISKIEVLRRDASQIIMNRLEEIEECLNSSKEFSKKEN